MICEEKDLRINELARYEKEILGIRTKYVFEKRIDGLYHITVMRGTESGDMAVGKDFLSASEFFGLVVKSDTLPENVEDIEKDIAKGRFL